MRDTARVSKIGEPSARARSPTFETLTVYALLLLFVTSCVEYNPRPIERPAPEAWKGPTKASPVACPGSDGAPIAAWWRLFKDGDLDEYEAAAFAGNLSIQTMVARLDEALALLTAARSGLYPEIDLYVSFNRQRLSKSVVTAFEPGLTTPASSPGTTPVPPAPAAPPPLIPPIKTPSNTSLNLSLLQFTPQLSYQLDFWGKVRMGARAAFEDAAQIEEQLATAYLMTSASVAKSYFGIRAIDAQIAILDLLVDVRKAAASLDGGRYIVGIDMQSPTLEAEISLFDIESQKKSLLQQRALAENALAVLLGQPASDFHVARKRFAPHTPAIPTGLPSAILAQRPDIRAADHATEAARLRVGVAKTAFFPTLLVTGYMGWESTSLSQLFKWRNHVLSATASALQTIIDGGNILAQFRAARARYEQSVATLLNTIVQAYQDGENALTTLSTATSKRELMAKELVAARANTRLFLGRYRSGIANFLDIVDAEVQKLQTQQQLLVLTLSEVSATIDLIQAMGGIWDAVVTVHVVPW